MDTEVLNRYRGCMIGSACGDALGAPVEFVDREELEKSPVSCMEGGGALGWARGQVTDDTAMSLGVALGLVFGEGVDTALITKHFLEWAKGNPPDMGGQTRKALKYIRRSGDWRGGEHVRKINPEACGNGSVMRTHPVGLAFPDDEAKRDQAAADISRITHAHPCGITACQLVSSIVADLVLGKPLNETLDFWLAKEQYKEFDLRGQPRDQISSSGHARDTVQAAIWALTQADNFKDTLITAVNLGQDADSVGAVAGAIAGTYYGFEAIPTEWIGQLRYSQEPDGLVNILAMIAQGLYQGKNFDILKAVESWKF